MSQKTVAIVQARMDSTRLPGKSMADLAGKPLIWHVLNRLKRCREVYAIVLAIPNKKSDDILEQAAKSSSVTVFRGSENDLADRFYEAAKAARADVIVRICADNPVLEPAEIDRIVQFHRKGESDFSSNLYEIQKNGYPDGLGAEVFSFMLLETLWKEAKDPKHREHIHTFFYDNPTRFRIRTIPCPPEFRRPELKLDVNTPEELSFIRSIYEYWFPRKPEFHITDIINWYDTIYSPSKKLSPIAK